MENNHENMVNNAGAHSGMRAQKSYLEMRKLNQQQLVLLLHAHRCQTREAQQNGEGYYCSVNHCQTMRNVLVHMTHCQAGKNCAVPHCSSSNSLIAHWKNCNRGDCPFCLPIKQGKWTLTTNMSAEEPSQAEVAEAHMSHSPGFSVGPVFDSSNVSGAVDLLGDIVEHLQVQDGLEIEQAMPKEWHKTITPDHRAHLVQKLVQGIFPNPSPEMMLDSRMDSLVAYARKVESDLYELANSRSEYCFLLSAKLNRVQKELDEKRKMRLQQ